MMSSSLTLRNIIPPIDPHAWLRNAGAWQVGSMPSDEQVLFCDLDRNRLLKNFSEVSARRLLVLAAPRATDRSREILENVAQAIFSKNHLFHRAHPKEIKRLFQRHLSIERCFFEDYKDASFQSAYQGFLLMEERVYPLHQQSVEVCYVYRAGGLLEFHLSPQQFVQLELEDILLIIPPEEKDSLIQSKMLQHFSRALQYRTLGEKRRESAAQQVMSLHPIIGVRLQPERSPAEEKASPSQTQAQRLLMMFIAMWVIAFAASLWLNP